MRRSNPALPPRASRPDPARARADTDVLRGALAIFEAVADLEPPAQEAMLAELCGEDRRLRAEVDELLGIRGRSADDETQGLRAILPGSGHPGQLLDGGSIGPYTIVRRAGVGGMGVVYEAEQDEPKRRVALKVLRFELHSEALAARFRREIQLLAQLQHPGIVQVYGTGVLELDHGALPYFAMEFVDGEPLDAFVAAHDLDVSARLRLVIQICEAIEHAHSRGVLHRDLKPSNILVTDLGGGRFQPRVIDFGIAREAEGVGQETLLRTSTGQWVGTLPYMSPERMLGNDAVDARADVYALGVVLYELLVGRLPLELSELSLADAARRLEREEPTAVGQIEPALRGDLETVVATALAKDPARRYPTAEALGHDLQRFLDDEPIRARPLSAFYYLSKSLRRHRVFVAGALATMLALAAGLVVAVVLANRNEVLAVSERSLRVAAERASGEAEDARLASDRARVEAEATRDELRRTLYRSEMRQVDDSLAGTWREKAQLLLDRWRPKPGLEDVRGFEWYLASAMAFTDELVVPGFRDGPLYWTENGIFSTERGEWLVAEPDDGSVEREADFRSGSPWALSFADDLDVFSSKARGFFVARRSSEEILARGSLDNEFGVIADTILRGDGRQVVAVVQGHAWSDGLLVFDVETQSWIGDRIPIASFGSRAQGYSPCGRWFASAAHRGELKIWDTATWQETASVAVLGGRGGDLGSGLAWSPDGSRIALGGAASGAIELIDVAARRLVQTLSGHYRTVVVLAWHPDGRRLASGGRDSAVWLWDLEAGEGRVLGGHEQDVMRLAFSPDGRRIASTGLDHKLRVFDVDARAAVSRLCVADGLRPGTLAWHPDGAHIVFSAGDASRVVAADSGRVIETVEGQHLRWSDDGSLFSVLRGGRTHVVDVGSGGTVCEIEACRGPGYWAPVEHRLVVCGSGKGIWAWDAASAETRQALAAHWRMFWLGWAPDGLVALSSSLRFWSLDRSLEQRRGPVDLGYDPIVHAVSRDGTLVAMDHRNLQLHLMDVETGQVAQRLIGHTAQPRAVAWSPDGRRIASVADDHTLRIWDPETAEEVFVLTFDRPVLSLAWSPDGQRMALAIGDEVHLVDARPR